WHESHQAQRALLGWKSTLAAVWKVQLLPFLIPLALSMAVQAFQPHPQPCAQCPFDWIGFRGKCYRFSEDESNWTSSHNNCSALASHDLFPLLSLQSFAMRHIGSSPHWVGLTREGQEHPWQWLNRSPSSHPPPTPSPSPLPPKLTRGPRSVGRPGSQRQQCHQHGHRRRDAPAPHGCCRPTMGDPASRSSRDPGAGR
uniref:C-type lectin domain-containing protein n=1 Tax=Coturnix japonica TaxID=93934 RepID=A0A8C2TXS4_COTJA